MSAVRLHIEYDVEFMVFHSSRARVLTHSLTHLTRSQLHRHEKRKDSAVSRVLCCRRMLWIGRNCRLCDGDMQQHGVGDAKRANAKRKIHRTLIWSTLNFVSEALTRVNVQPFFRPRSHRTDAVVSLPSS